MTDPLRFTLDDADDPGVVLAAVGDRLELVDQGHTTERRTVLDTFDWRVWRRGDALEHVRPAGRGATVDRPVLRWRDAAGRVRAEVPAARPPRWAEDLPSGPLATELGPALAMRALLPLAEARVTTSVHAVLDDETKTVARLVVHQARAEDGGPLPTVLEVVEVRGYGRQAQRLAEVLAGLPSVHPGGADVAELAVRAQGLAPGGYSSKLRLDLDPATTAAAAWTAVLRQLLTTLLANEPGTRDDLDSEFLHDYRVAVRRTRSVLAQGGDVLDPEGRDRFRDEFRWLGATTSPTRDLDVWLLTLPELAAGIDEALAPELAPLRALLVRHQRREHRRLVRALDSDRHSRLLARYERWVDDPRGSPGVAPDAERPATLVAGSRIAKAFRRVERDGRAIDDDSPATDLHELRKDAKRLRYGLECFGSLFDPALTQPLVRDLKSLQDVLGEFQDCEVQVTSLRGYADELAAARAPSASLLAMGALVEHLAERQAAARATFADRFDRFDTKANRSRVRAIGDGGTRP